MARIGILGGSFSPVHNAHIALAEFFYKDFDLDKLIFVPAYQSPFKTRDQYKIDDYHRIAMLRLAVEDKLNFEIDLYEIDKKEISYSINTIDYLADKYKSYELFWLIGADQSKDFHKWKSWRDILTKVTVCVAGRNQLDKLFDDEVNQFCKSQNILIQNLNFEEIELSSSEIRSRIEKSESIYGLVSDKVYDYINKFRLYR